MRLLRALRRAWKSSALPATLEYQLLVVYLILEVLREFGHFRYFRDFEVETIGLKETSRFCSDEKYGPRLGDTVLDWEVSDAMATLAGAEYWDNDVAVAII
ncbi:hypothetical protein HN51_004718 [Arachis hypogaea]